MKTLTLFFSISLLPLVINENASIDLSGNWFLYKRTIIINNDEEKEAELIIEYFNFKKDSTFRRILIDSRDYSFHDTADGFWKVEYIKNKPSLIFATFDGLGLGLIDTNEILMLNEKKLILERIYRIDTNTYQIRYYYDKIPE